MDVGKDESEYSVTEIAEKVAERVGYFQWQHCSLCQ